MRSTSCHLAPPHPRTIGRAGGASGEPGRMRELGLGLATKTQRLEVPCCFKIFASSSLCGKGNIYMSRRSVLIESLQATPRDLARLLRPLDAAAARWRPAADDWCIADVVAHLAYCEVPYLA